MDVFGADLQWRDPTSVCFGMADFPQLDNLSVSYKLVNLGAKSSPVLPKWRHQATQGPPWGYLKVNFQRPCQFLAINAHKMAPRTNQWLQERTWNAPRRASRGQTTTTALQTCAAVPRRALVFKAYRLVYHSTLGLREIEIKERKMEGPDQTATELETGIVGAVLPFGGFRGVRPRGIPRGVRDQIRTTTGP